MGPWGQYSWIVGLGGVAAFGVGLGTGSNNWGNNFGASVGSRALTYRQALFLGLLCEFCGAFFLGPKSGPSIRSSIADWQQYTAIPEALMYGLLCQLAVSTCWMLLCNRFTLPVSATHTTVGGLIGMALVMSSGSVNWAAASNTFPFVGGLASVLLSMVVSPVLSAMLGAVIFMLLRSNVLRSANAFHKAIWILPTCVCITVIANLLFLAYKLGILSNCPSLQDQWFADLMDAEAESAGLLHKGARRTWRTVLAMLDYDMHAKIEQEPDVARIHNNTEDFDASAEECFKGLQILTSCCLAVAHGANDVPNAISQLATIYAIFQTHAVSQSSPTNTWILAIGAAGMALGGLVYAYNNMTTLGVRIARISPARGFAIELAAVIVSVLATKLQLPISTTHVTVSATLGVGALEGAKNMNKPLMRKIVGGWVGTIIAPALATAALVAQGEPP
ncbi:hypothetical protein WJX72_000309 [[Myrmecia] bisecta]|uniref:Phosphate transporter n=1 Tax=[Myrmecia] bisecta TaxID=41462 RepID=A0AAW1R4D6_9CHLO